MGWGKPNQTHREAGGRVGVKADRGSRKRYSGPGRGWQLHGRDSSLGEGRQRAKEMWQSRKGRRERERQRQETSLRGTPGRQKPAPTETHRHPEWERDSQRNSTGKTHGTFSPAKRTVFGMEREEGGSGVGRQRRGSREERTVPWQAIAAHGSREVVLSENGHLMVCRACDRYVM